MAKAIEPAYNTLMDYIQPPSTLPPGSSVWAYLRDSGGEGQDRSTSRQQDELREYCLRHGLELAHAFIDIARSGGSTDGRDQFLEMIDASKDDERRPVGLLLWNYARFARDLDDASYYKALLRKRGLVIHSLTDPIPEGIYARVVETIIDIANEEKRRQTSRDVRSGLASIVRQYGAVPGVPPRGFKYDPLPPVLNPRTGQDRLLHRWIPDPDLVPVVQRAFEMRARGATLRQIQGETGLYENKNNWSYFFANRLYLGELVYGDIVILDYCEPMVTPDLWESANLVSRRRSQSQQGVDIPRRVTSSFLLSGLVFCHQCGGAMVGQSNYVRSYYVCARRKRRFDCNSRSVPKDPLERGVINQLIEQILTLENMLNLQVRIMDQFSKSKERSDEMRVELERRLRGAKRRVTNLTAAVAERGHSQALLSSLDAAELEAVDLRLQLDALTEVSQPSPDLDPPSMEEMASGIRAVLDGGNLVEKQTIVRGLISRIVVDRTDDRILGVMYYIPPQALLVKKN